MSVYRAYVYSFLSVAFSYPSEEILEELRGGLDDLSLSLKELGLEFDTNTLRRVIEEGKGRILDLKGEWTSLFSTSLKAPANETAYEMDKAARKAWELADIEGFYRAFGLEVKPPTEPDSLVAELEFMAYLIKKEMYAQERGMEEEAKITKEAYTTFFRDHIGRWYRIFTELVIENTEEEYYKLMANLLRLFLDGERKGVEGIRDIEEYRKEVLEGSTWKCGF
ncbi:MAG: molecular chaperone [Aquificaceae bacterium]